MKQRVHIDFDRARVNIVDGFQALKMDCSDDADQFSYEVKSALDNVPDELPYIEDLREAVDNQEFEEAFRMLSEFATYIREYDGEEYTFDYQSLAPERVEKDYNQFSGKLG